MCTVQGDIHDIGKNLVTMMLEGAGFQVFDLGVDITLEKLMDQVDEIKPDILGLSAMLTTTMPEMGNVINTLADRDLKKDIKVMIGGAPVDKGFSDEIGADGYGEDASQAVKLARAFMSDKK
jgi:5-methyltetrahydrofolate--homocysteine methyltransferase